MIPVAYLLCAALCVAPFVNSAVALILGLAFALTLGNPFREKTKKTAPKVLALSIVGLGFGMNLIKVAEAGAQGFLATAVSLVLIIAAGIALQKILRIEEESSLLVSIGTAICGGSAIAAVSTAIRAKPSSTSMALACVFLLNSVALLIFPPLGHLIGLSEHDFGLWAALAIHDTSSVVGATLQYGPEALGVGTTVKLARALWIVPLTMLVGWFWRRHRTADSTARPSFPWFIIGFLAAAALATWIPALQPAGRLLETLARRGFVLTLFLIGSNLDRAALKSLGIKPFLQALILWALVLAGSLAALRAGVL